MGAWGPGLYSDDVTEDVRGIYVDKLHRGKNGEQASKEMIAEFEWAWSDEDDAPVFWFAMADMQWNYGRLQEEVKKKAKANGDSSEKKKGRTFDKDFWGFDKSSVTGKINEILSKKFVTKTEIAEAVGIDSQRVAVHFSNLRKGGFVLKKKKDEMRGVLYKLTKEKSE